MLATQVKLMDIDCVESFVAQTIESSGLRPHLADSEHEDLIAEGITILYELAERYEPQRAGYATSGRFSGFAAMFLPRRLGDAWHQKHPEHRRIAGEDGKRRWHYHPEPISLDSYLGGMAQDRNTVNGGQGDHVNRETTIRPAEQWSAVEPR